MWLGQADRGVNAFAWVCCRGGRGGCWAAACLVTRQRQVVRISSLPVPVTVLTFNRIKSRNNAWLINRNRGHVCSDREQHFVQQEAQQSAQNGGIIGYEKEAVGAKPDPI